tara:strand:+ start:2554 stop:3012 length:459 start_codon:yes stop_codon:yes gene_type:complete
MSNEYEDFSDNKPLDEHTQSEGSKQFEAQDKHYRVKNIRYGDKTVKGRIIGRGENQQVIPEEEVAKLAQYHCTNKEMADFFGVKLQTFMDNFRDIITKNKLITKQRLRQKMLQQALSGDRVLMIFLSKNYLGMSDNPIDNESTEILPWIDDE